jgi:hypothetical protein
LSPGPGVKLSPGGEIKKSPKKRKFAQSKKNRPRGENSPNLATLSKDNKIIFHLNIATILLHIWRYQALQVVRLHVRAVRAEGDQRRREVERIRLQNQVTELAIPSLLA